MVRLCAVFTMVAASMGEETRGPVASLQQSVPDPKIDSGPRWSEPQKAAQRKSALDIIEKIKNAISTGKKQYIIPPGNYRFDAQLGQSFVLEGVRDFIIQASGATFWSDGRFGVHLKSCSGVTLRGLTFDMDPVPWIQGRIEAIHADTKTINFSLESGYTQCRPDLLQGGRRLLFFDPVQGLEIHSRDTSISKVEAADNGQWRISGFNVDEVFRGMALPRPVQTGDRIVLLTGGAANISLVHCQDIVLEDVTIYATTGFGFHESDGAGGNRYLRCKIIRRPGTNRLIASAADAFHSASVQRGPQIEECEFSFAGDDLLAIHGFFLVSVGPSRENEVVLACPYPVDLAPGSTFRFFRPPDGRFIDEATIKNIEPVVDPSMLEEVKKLPEKYRIALHVAIREFSVPSLYRIGLDRTVTIQDLDLAAGSGACGAGAIVRNSYLHDGHIRGLLAKTQDLTVEGNRIERTAYSGIDLEPELYWLEGPFEHNIRVINNTLAENQWSTFAQNSSKAVGGAITVEDSFGQNGKTLVPGVQNDRIEITNNRIQRPGGIGIFMANASHVKVDGNQIDQPFAATKDLSLSIFDYTSILSTGWKVTPTELATLKAPIFAIYIQSCDEVEATDNHVSGGRPSLRGSLGFGPGVVPVQRSADVK